MIIKEATGNASGSALGRQDQPLDTTILDDAVGEGTHQSADSCRRSGNGQSVNGYIVDMNRRICVSGTIGK